jgi:5-methylcytosine-specific restriction protein A
MSLHAALSLFLEEYPLAVRSEFAGNAVAEFIRKDVPEAIQTILGSNERYLVHGSAGQGVWARVPWAAVFDRFITETAQNGYYLVYLVREDFSGVYLSLNQGVTSVREQYGSDAKHALHVRANDFIARLGRLADGLIQGPIDLGITGSSSLGAYYEHGAICSVFYPKAGLPSDQRLSADLLHFIDLYFTLVSRETRLYEQADAEEDEEGLGAEDLRSLREHKRVERNKKLAARAKRIHGYKCKACGFDFELKYGELGRGFIEAHHLTPLAALKGQKVTLDARNDFTVLCANCHRMIHKTEFVSRVEEFRAKYVIEPSGQHIPPGANLPSK